MMTPQEVSQHAFAKASFGGYNMAMVDEFLDQLTADYTALYKENAVLKSKIKVLVDKVEEYRSTDEAMRMALLAAQKMADKLVEEAVAKKNEILSEAEASLAQRRLVLQQDLASEQMRLNAARSSTANFVSKLKELYQRELSFLESLGQMEAPAVKKPEPDPVASAAADIESSVQKIADAQIPAPAPIPIPVQKREPEEAEEVEDTVELPELDKKPVTPAKRLYQDEDAEDSRRQIDFSNLQFGKEYEVR